MATPANNLSRSEKILLSLYELGNGKKKKVYFEDIVATVFERYSTEFALKGYPQYPDSDLINKPLYTSKKKGHVVAENKVFSLTDRGLDLAEQLSKRNQDGSEPTRAGLSRSTEIEFSRVKNSEGFALFRKGEQDLLSDSDFYKHLGVTVRTQKNAFIARLATMKAVVDELEKRGNDPLISEFVAYHKHMMNRYSNIIDFFTQTN